MNTYEAGAKPYNINVTLPTEQLAMHSRNLLTRTHSNTVLHTAT